MANRRMRDPSGRRLPFNADGTVIRRTGGPAPDSSGSRGGNTVYAPDIPVLLYYLLKVVFFFLCLAEGTVGASAVGSFRTFLFGPDTGFRGILIPFFPMITWIVSSGAGLRYLFREVERSDWKRIFFVPLVTLVGFVAVVVSLWLLAWSLKRWWTFLLFLILAPAVKEFVVAFIDELL